MKTANEVAVEVTRSYYTRSSEWPLSQWQELIAYAITEDRAEREREMEELKDENKRLEALATANGEAAQRLVNKMVGKWDAYDALKAENDTLKSQLCATTQSTICGICLVRKHTPVRNDSLGGYVCGGCLEQAYENATAENTKLREALRPFAEFQGCGDCDPCIGGRPDQCAVGSVSVTPMKLCPVCHGLNEGTDGPPCPKCDDVGEIVDNSHIRRAAEALKEESK